jgi:hypothetical protein
VYTALKAATGFTTLATGGLFPVQLPDNASLPAAVYEVISGAPSGSGKTATLNEYRVQVSCMAASIDTARSMRDAVMAVAFGAGWRWSLGPELRNDEGTFYLVPVDLMFEGV